MTRKLLAIIALATGCYAQAPAETVDPLELDSVSASDLDGATYCELGQPGMICFDIDQASGGEIRYAITRDDCTETGMLQAALTFLVDADSTTCIGGKAPHYRASAQFTDGGLDLQIGGAVIELEQVK
jgi:hypothetical protein